MRRLLIPILLLTISCRALVPLTGNSGAALPEPHAALPLITSTPVQQQARQSLTPLPRQQSTQTPVASATATTAQIQPDDLKIQYHPDGPLFVGDIVSVEVIPPPYMDLDGHSLQVEVDDGSDKEPVCVFFTDYGISGRSQATLLWFWDTRGLSEGAFAIHFSIQPTGLEWRETVTLYQVSDIPPPKPDATWRTVESDCCRVHYITGTAAERDLQFLLNMVDERAKQASRRMETDLGSKIDVNFIPRVWGHGGFANQEVSISYLDRNYAGGSQDIILHHELIHILDGRLGGDFRPVMLIEGVAVYQTGGHFKAEVLMPRAAALLHPKPGCLSLDAYREKNLSGEDISVCGLDWYIPLDELMEDFYSKQHEIGYLIAGSLVEYMVERWGWDGFSGFYRDFESSEEMQPGKNRVFSQGDRGIDEVLERHFGINLEQLEDEFLAALSEERLSLQLLDDVRMTVSYYDTVRRYQKLLDPSAYFATAWSPSSVQMRQRGIVADYLRHPAQIKNIVLEIMFASANEDLRTGKYQSLEENLQAVNSVLDAVATDAENPLRAHPLASTYKDLVLASHLEGYETQLVRINDERARVWANISGADIIIMDFERSADGEWRLMTIIE